jgi:RNA polymerase sigma-70 factor (ECF subfamily)
MVQDVIARTELASDIEGLFREEAPRIWRALFAYTRDRDVASDAVAEAFAQALARGGGLRSPQHWVWKVAWRIAAGELKERQQTEAPADDPGCEMQEPPWDLLVALSKLSPNQRAALILRHYAGYRTREVAAILGSSPATVRVHLSKGRQRLRRLLEDQDDPDD